MHLEQCLYREPRYIQTTAEASLAIRPRRGQLAGAGEIPVSTSAVDRHLKKSLKRCLIELRAILFGI